MPGVLKGTRSFLFEQALEIMVVHGFTIGCNVNEMR